MLDDKKLQIRSAMVAVFVLCSLSVTISTANRAVFAGVLGAAAVAGAVICKNEKLLSKKIKKLWRHRYRNKILCVLALVGGIAYHKRAKSLPARPHSINAIPLSGNGSSTGGAPDQPVILDNQLGDTNSGAFVDEQGSSKPVVVIACLVAVLCVLTWASNRLGAAMEELFDASQVSPEDPFGVTSY